MYYVSLIAVYVCGQMKQISVGQAGCWCEQLRNLDTHNHRFSVAGQRVTKPKPLSGLFPSPRRLPRSLPELPRLQIRGSNQIGREEINFKVREGKALIARRFGDYCYKFPVPENV